MGESEMDIEFGYLSEEESIFQSFSQDVERILPKIKKTFTLKDDIKGTKSSIKDVFRRDMEETRTFEFMIKFKIEMDSEDSSSIYSASGTPPINIIDERDKKKFLKVRFYLLFRLDNRKKYKWGKNLASLTRMWQKRIC